MRQLRIAFVVAATLGRRVGRWRSVTLAGEEDVERRPPALALVDPRAATVQLGEPGYQGEPDPRPGRVRGGRRTLAERLEDRSADLGWNARTVVLDSDRDAAIPRRDLQLDTPVGGGMPCGVHEQVLDDPLDLGRVDRDQDRPGRGD